MNNISNLIEVKESESLICPYCNYIHKVNEGASEMLENGYCIITCGSCWKSYYYVTDNSIEKDSCYMCGSDLEKEEEGIFLCKSCKIRIVDSSIKDEE